MRRGTSTGQFILAGIWVFLALFWFFVNKNVLVGCVWIAAACAVLIVGLVKRKQEKAEESEKETQSQ